MGLIKMRAVVRSQILMETGRALCGTQLPDAKRTECISGPNETGGPEGPPAAFAKALDLRTPC